MRGTDFTSRWRNRAVVADRLIPKRSERIGRSPSQDSGKYGTRESPRRFPGGALWLGHQNLRLRKWLDTAPGVHCEPQGTLTAVKIALWRLATQLVDRACLRRQLVMYRPHLHGLPPLILPPGYELRTFREGDEEVWGRIMEGRVGSGWDIERVKRELTSQPQFIHDGVFFVTYGDMPIGSACAWRPTAEEWTHGVLHMVSVLEDHRGRRLGECLSISALRWFRDQGFKDVSLSTDDWRLPAIKQYLGMGFQPVITDASMGRRWRRVKAALELPLQGVQGPSDRHAEDARGPSEPEA